MGDNRFDRISKFFAERRLSRRQALAAGGAGVATAVGLGAASAQEATPVAEPVPEISTDEKVQYLFVQSYRSGAITPADVPDRYTVTLEGGVGQTIYFANRPSRDVDAGPTDQFLDGLGFSEDNPPNAALVLEVEPGDEDIAVVELYDPTFDPDANTVTYDVEVLQNWEQSLEMGFSEAPTDLADLVPEFGAAHVFIDDCPDTTIMCVRPGSQAYGVLGLRGMCWRDFWCHMCFPEQYTRECNETFDKICQGKCQAEVQII